MTKKEAYVSGLTFGLVKHGGLEQLERSNASMKKIGAALCKLHRKGKLKKSAKLEKLAVNWGEVLTGAGGGAALGAGIGAPFGAVGALPGALIGAGLGGLGGLFFGPGRGAPAAVGAGPGAAPKLPEFMTPQVMEYLKSQGVDVGKFGAAPAAAATAAAPAKKGPSPYMPTQKEELAPWARYMGLRGPGEFAAQQRAMLAGLGRRVQAQQTADWLRQMFAPL